MKHQLDSTTAFTIAAALLLAAHGTATAIESGDVIVVDLGKIGQETSGNWNNVSLESPGANLFGEDEILVADLVRYSDGTATGVGLVAAATDTDAPADGISGQMGIGGASVSSVGTAASFTNVGTIPDSAQIDVHFVNDGDWSLVFTGLDASLFYNLEIMSKLDAARNAHNITVNGATISVDPSDTNYVTAFSGIAVNSANEIVIGFPDAGGSVDLQHINAMELTAYPVPSVTVSEIVLQDGSPVYPGGPLYSDTEDTLIRSDQGSTNYGTQNTVRIRDRSNDDDGLFRFGMAGVGGGFSSVDVTSASLTLTTQSLTNYLDGADSYDLFLVDTTDQGWTELGATYNAKDGTNAWNVGTGRRTPVGTTTAAASGTPYDDSHIATIDMGSSAPIAGDTFTFTFSGATEMALIESWLAGGANGGFVIVGRGKDFGTDGPFWYIHSSEAAAVSARPKLTLAGTFSTTPSAELKLTGFTYDPGTGASAVSIEGVAGTRYKLVEAADLDFSTPDPVPLTGVTLGTQDGDGVITDGSGNATVQFNLGTSKDATFIRAEEAP